MMERKQLVSITIMAIVFILSSCNTQQSADTPTGNESDIMNISETKENISQYPSRLAIQKVKHREELADVIAINSEKDLLVAVQIKQMDSFRTKKIEGDVKSAIEKGGTAHEVNVSSDKKIFLEIEELLSEWKKKDFSKKELTKKIESIKTLSEEQT